MPDNLYAPVTQLLTLGRPEHSVVAWYQGSKKYWTDFIHDVNRLTAQLKERNEVRWGLFLEESYEFAVALLALLHSDKVPVLPGNNHEGTTKRLTAEVDALLGEFKDAESSFEYRELIDSTTAGRADFSVLDEKQEIRIFTSGSTGQPKAEIKQLHQLTAEMATLQGHWGDLLDNTTVAATVNHQHIYGLLFKVLWPLCAGRPFISRSYQDPQSLLENAAQFGRVVWIASPAHLKRLHPALPWRDARNHLADIFSSGGALPEQSAGNVEEWYGKSPLEIYGSTESGGIAWRRQKRGANPMPWKPLAGVFLSQGALGQLQVRSPHLMPGVLLDTADVVTFVTNQRFQLQGRLDRIVKIEEKRVSLPELESAMRSSALVADARALPLTLSGRQSLGVAVELSDSGKACYDEIGKFSLVRQLKALLTKSFEAVVLPRRWRFVSALPINEQGKIQQAAIAALFEPPPKILPSVVTEQLNDNQSELVLDIEKDLAYFPGHFPAAAILPGVVQVSWAEHFGRRYFALGTFSSMEGLKFQRVLRPGQQVSLYLQYDETRQVLRFQFKSVQGMHSQGRLTFDQV